MSFDFSIKESDIIRGIWILTPSISRDERGDIWTSFLKGDVEHLLPNGLCFNHDKFSTSEHNVLRGIHGDSKSWKLVTCVSGEIQQVVVDMRIDSPTYKHWQSFIIGQNNPQLICIPPNMGNAYYVISSKAVYHYKLAYSGDYIDSNEQFSIKWNDKDINIVWPSISPILSDRDR